MRKHPLDLTSLLAGLVFVAVAAVYLLGQATGNRIDATYVLPVTLVALGLAGIVGGVGRAWQKPEPTATGTDTDTDDDAATEASTAT